MGWVTCSAISVSWSYVIAIRRMVAVPGDCADTAHCQEPVWSKVRTGWRSGASASQVSPWHVAATPTIPPVGTSCGAVTHPEGTGGGVVPPFPWPASITSTLKVALLPVTSVTGTW